MTDTNINVDDMYINIYNLATSKYSATLYLVNYKLDSCWINVQIEVNHNVYYSIPTLGPKGLFWKCGVDDKFIVEKHLDSILILSKYYRCIQHAKGYNLFVNKKRCVWLR